MEGVPLGPIDPMAISCLPLSSIHPLSALRKIQIFLALLTSQKLFVQYDEFVAKSTIDLCYKTVILKG